MRDRVESVEERAAAEPFVRLLPAPFESVDSLEEAFSPEAVIADAVLDCFDVPAFADADPVGGLLCVELELFCVSRPCVPVFGAEPPLDRLSGERFPEPVCAVCRVLERFPLAVFSAVRVVADFSCAVLFAVPEVDGRPFAVFSSVRPVRAPSPRALPVARPSPGARGARGLDSLLDAADWLGLAFPVAGPAFSAALFDALADPPSAGAFPWGLATVFLRLEEARGLEPALLPLWDEVWARPEDGLGEEPSAGGA